MLRASDFVLGTEHRKRVALGACPSNGVDRVTSAVDRDVRRPARRRWPPSLSAGNEADGSCCSTWLDLASLARKKTPPVNRREQGGCGRIFLSRAVDDGGHRRPSLSASSTHKTPVRDHTPLFGQAPRAGRADAAAADSLRATRTRNRGLSSRTSRRVPTDRRVGRRAGPAGNLRPYK